MKSHLALAALLLASCASTGGDGPAVTPQRPTYSSDTSTTAEGTLELEAGAAYDPGDAWSTPMLLKWGVRQDTEFFVGLDAYRWIDTPQGSRSGVGDSALGVRHRFWEHEATSAAVLGAVIFPTAGRDLGTGEVDWTGAGIVSQGLGEDASATLYYQLTWLGERRGRDEWEQGYALALSKLLGDELGVFGEVAGVDTAGGGEPLFGTFGLVRNLGPSLALDGGVVVGFNSDAPDLQFVFGLTTNFGRIESE